MPAAFDSMNAAAMPQQSDSYHTSADRKDLNLCIWLAMAVLGTDVLLRFIPEKGNAMEKALRDYYNEVVYDGED